MLHPWHFCLHLDFFLKNSVIKENLEKEFDSIKDTIKYFDVLNIKLDRKTLYLRLKDGKIYKGYSFSYKQLEAV